MAYIIDVPSYTDNRGNLVVIEKILPFEIKRVYYIYNAHGIRGGHRHKRNIQALVCINGQCIISNNDGEKTEDFLLDTPQKILILEEKDWHTMHSFSENAVLLALASEYYDEDDYIEEEYT